MTTMTNETSTNRTARLAGVLATSALAFGLIAAGASAAVPQGPSGNAFYNAPDRVVRKAPHGKALRAQAAPQQFQDTYGGATVKKILYKSTDGRNRPVEVSGLLMVPSGTAPPGGWPLITWLHGTTGLADECAPSRDTAEELGGGYIAYANATINNWLEDGYAVVATDYQGLGPPGLHEYLIGTSEGKSALDSVLAARQVNTAIGNKYAIAGHSQGGHAALWATKLARRYLRNHTLVGTVAYAPASQLSEQAHLINQFTTNGGLAGLALQIIKGASTQMSKDITKVLNPRVLSRTDAGLSSGGRSLWQRIDYECSGEIGNAAGGPSGIAAADLLMDNDLGTGGVFNNPIARDLDRVLKANNPLFNNVPTPVYVPQGSADGTVFPFFTNDHPASVNVFGTGLVYLLNQGRGNADVTYQSFPGLDHTSVITDSVPTAAVDAKLAAWF
ncbi:MAG: alpha/beta hydrolase family protein [bacterium]